MISAMISAIVLAAGQSTRMGGENKLLLPFRGTTIVENIVAAVTGSKVGETIVVVGHEAERVRERLAGRPVTLVENPHFAEGMGSTLKVGLRAASENAAGYIVCLTDLPLVESADLDRLIGAFREEGQQRIVVPFHGGQRGNPVIFPARYREEVLTTRGPVAGCRGIVARYPEAVLEVEMASDHVLRDIDTPEDYRGLVAGAS